MLLQFPFLVREKGALIDRQSLSCISLPQVATGLRFACRARSVSGDLREQRAKLTCKHVNLATAATTGKHVCRCSQTKLCTWMTATYAVASHSSQRAVLQTPMCRIRQMVKQNPPIRFLNIIRGGGTMAIFHLSIKIVSRSSGKGAESGKEIGCPACKEN